MDSTHPPNTIDLYHMFSPDLEPTGKDKARLPKKHRRLSPEAETKRKSCTWGQLERLAQDQNAWTAASAPVGARVIVACCTLRIEVANRSCRSNFLPHPIPALTLLRQAPGRVATGVLIF